MTYHVLARKWRPQTFSDLVGQTHVVKALTYALSENQVHHAYLFTGTRGVGKTSIARIFAKSLNCEVNGISPTPCGECESCQEIKSGKFVDLIEVDAASRTGVDETRELIDSVSYLPAKGRFKVYLIDEVHMFSKSSFNALLKTLEEPPAHVKFILATTDPEKLPITILSRCLQFNLKSLTQAQIKQHLMNICEAESIQYDGDALALLANAGDGSIRDTLSMTDQAIAYGQGELSMRAVTEILGTIQPTDIEAILFAIATNNPTQLSQALHRLDNYEVDARAFLIEIMRRLQQMAWAKEGIVHHLSKTLQSTVNDIPKALLHLWYDIAEKALPNLSLSGDARATVEMVLLRMLAFTPNDWVPRQRTPLEGLSDEADKPTNTAPVEEKSQPQSPEVQPTPHDVPAVNHNPTTSTPPWEEQGQTKPTSVKAQPIEPQDSLEAAEVAFSNEQVAESSPVPSTPSVDSEDQHDNQVAAETPADVSPQHSDPEPVATVATPVAGSTDNADAIASEPKPVSGAELSNAWHLSSEADSEPAPSLDDIKAMMQRGRDIQAPASTPSIEDTAAAEVVVAEPKAEPQPSAMVFDMSSLVGGVIDEDISTSEIHNVDDANGGNDDAIMISVSESPAASQDTPAVSAEVSEEVETVGIVESVGNVAAVTETEAVVEVSDAPQAESISSQASASAVSVEHFDWYQTYQQLSLSNYSKHFAGLGILRVENTDGRIHAIFDLSPKNEVLRNEDNCAELEEALQKYFAAPISFSVNLTEINQETPADIMKKQQVKETAETLETFTQLPTTQRIVSELGGQIIDSTVKISVPSDNF